MAEYTTLTNADLLALAQDTLRGRESDRFRVSILNEPNKEARLASYDEELAGIKETIAALEVAVEAEQPAPVEEAAPDDADPEA